MKDSPSTSTYSGEPPNPNPVTWLSPSRYEAMDTVPAWACRVRGDAASWRKVLSAAPWWLCSLWLHFTAILTMAILYRCSQPRRGGRLAGRRAVGRPSVRTRAALSSS